ncbi:MAG: tRNA (N6-isopentenyl adenosine(37)-C2)-methylthiotransferase MiaB [Clostridia bacterium]|nr:tRNA (N6-isopentenyl adenosine(37)-C2)-methylthiotransferase MiaB [Clostridia bacterium]
MDTIKKLYFINTYGCQMNIHESEKIAGVLEKLGYSPCDSEQKADVLVYNTCCIRETAEFKIHGHIGEAKILKQQNPNLIVVVCGCMSQQSGVAQNLKRRFPFVDVILGTSNLDLLEQAIVNAQNEKSTVNVEEKNNVLVNLPKVRTSRPNAWVNIIYGCNNFCTYCIVPYVRGREHSRPQQDVLNEVKELVSLGYKEITLLGQNVNSYGNDLKDGTNFSTLLNQVAKIEGDFRIRYLTNHPKDLTDDVIEAIANNAKICNSIHLPVQSGSSAILKAMNRKYDRDDYLKLVSKLRKAIPDIGISTDIMVGFPGETDQDFLDTLDLVQKARFSSAFCFIYSRRKGTVADKMEQIPRSVKGERIKRLLEVQNVITKEISKEMEGTLQRVLVEGKNKKYVNTYCGRTENGRLVNIKSDVDLFDQFVWVKIKNYQSATLWGEIVKED